jgi:hypothetical protein
MWVETLEDDLNPLEDVLIGDVMLPESSIILPDVVPLDLDELIKESLRGLNGDILVGGLVFMVDHDQVLVDGQQDLPDIQLIRDLLNYLSGLQDAFNDQVWKLRQLILSVVQGLQVKEGTYQVGVVAIL